MDVFIFDFRAYGLSTNGTATFISIVEDYRDIAIELASRNYAELYVYGFSFGGVIALRAFPDGGPFERLIVDSAPARPTILLGLDCDESIDAIDALPPMCKHIAFVHGTQDHVVPRYYTQELIEGILGCGGVVNAEESFGHPFQRRLFQTASGLQGDTERRLEVVLGSMSHGIEAE